MLAPCSLLHPLSLLTSQTLQSWHQLHLCQIQCLSVTQPVTPLLLHLVFSWSLLVPTFSPFIIIPIISYSLLYAIHSHGSQTSLHSWCDSLIMSLYVSLLSLLLSLFSGMWTLPEAKLLHLFRRKYFHIPGFFSATVLSQLLWYKILKLVLISFPFLPFMFISVFLHTN